MRAQAAASVHVWTPVLVVLLLGFAAPWVLAGSGAFDGTSYTFCVAVLFNASASDIALMQSVFTAASQVFNDATDGQQKFGMIKIVPNSVLSDDAEFYVHPLRGRADPPTAGIGRGGRYGYKGEHVNLYWPDNFANTTVDEGAFGIAHEMGHLVFGLGDEYSPSGNTSCAANPAVSSLSFCLMDNYLALGSRVNDSAARPSLKELCVHNVGGILSHDPGHHTDQSRFNANRSCWDTIANHTSRAAAPPKRGQPPNLTPPPPSVVNFPSTGPGLSVVVVVDRSASMGNDNKFDYAKAGAIAYINSLSEGDRLAVVSFACAAGRDMELTAIDGFGAVKSTANSAVQDLELGSGTGISAGIQEAVDILIDAPVRPCRELILLLTDGDYNCDVQPTRLIRVLQTEGISLNALAVGEDLTTAGLTDLRNLAFSASGQFFAFHTPLATVSTFLELGARNVDKRQVGSLVGRETATGSENGTKPVQVGPLLVLAEVNMTEVSFFLVFNASAANLTVQDPAGRTVQVTGYNFTTAYSNFSSAQNFTLTTNATLLNASLGPNTSYAVGPDTRVDIGPNFVAVTILQPAPGIYNVSGVQVPNGTANASTAPAPAPKQAGSRLVAPLVPQLDLYAYGKNQLGAQLVAFSLPNGTVRAPTGVVIEGSLQYNGRRVLNADVTADVFFPNGTRAGGLRLLDNGDYAGNNDTFAGDGYYTARFAEYGVKTDGAYTFRLTARSGGNATVYPGETLFAGRSPPARVEGGVPDLVRQQLVSVVISNTPSFAPPAPPPAKARAPSPT